MGGWLFHWPLFRVVPTTTSVIIKAVSMRSRKKVWYTSFVIVLLFVGIDLNGRVTFCTIWVNLITQAFVDSLFLLRSLSGSGSNSAVRTNGLY